MVGGGIETTRGGDQFPGQLHACEHFAPRFMVVAGGFEDCRDALRGGAVLQEAEDGLPMWGVQGTSTQARQLGAIPFIEPLDTRDTSSGKEDVIGEDGWLGAEGMAGCKQKVVTFVTRIGCEQHAAADSFLQRRSWAGRAQWVGRWLAEGACEQDGAVRLMGEFDEGGQAAQQTRNGTGGIEDDQLRVQATDGVGQVIQIAGEREGAGAGGWARSIFDRPTEEQDVGGVATGGFQARFDRIGGRVVGGEKYDVARQGGRAIGKWLPTGDAGGQGESEEGKVTAGDGIEQGEVAERNATWPEPLEGFAWHIRKEESCR